MEWLTNLSYDEKGTRSVLVKLLTSAMNTRIYPSTVQYMDFLPALLPRRLLVYHLCEALGLIAKV